MSKHGQPVTFELLRVKAIALIQSKRFWVVMTMLLSILLQVLEPMEGRRLAAEAAAIMGAWVIGDSLRPTDNVWFSRRWWTMLAGLFFLGLSYYSIDLSQEYVTQGVLAFGSWIVGDAIRETKMKGDAGSAQSQVAGNK